MNTTRVVINTEKLSYAVELTRAVAHPLRLKILEFIDGNDKSLNVNEIYSNLGIEQSVTSQHLKIMKDAGVLFSTKSGKFVSYHINYDVLEKVQYGVSRYVGKAV